MKKILLTLLFIYIISGFILPVHAVHYYYKQIALGYGLSSTVYCTLVDKQGFIWIGTQAGLGRFDGFLVLIIRCIIIIIKTLHSDWYSNSAQPPVTVLWGWNFGIRTLCFAVTVGRAYACWT